MAQRRPVSAETEMLRRRIQQYPAAFGKTLAMMMKEKKITVEKLAEMTGLSDSTIKRLRRDDWLPTESDVCGICNALSLNPVERIHFITKAGYSVLSTHPDILNALMVSAT